MNQPTLTLHQAAEEIGVHYMTVYRYVRLGVLDATKVGGTWEVTRQTLDDFLARPDRVAGARPARPAPWAERLESRLIVGDYNGAWGVVEAALTAGVELDEIYLEVLTPAMVSIGERWASGEFDISVEHRATGIATRIIGRLGPRFHRRGRSRGSVILGAPAGEFHALPVAILGDLLRMRGWEVSDFGANVPSASLVHAVESTPDAVAVGLSATSPDNLDALADACASVRSSAPDLLVVVGGLAVADDDHAVRLGAHARAESGEAMNRLLTSYLSDHR
jgi:excisionase family DNA binding protein